jgi:hypothetical protein
MSKRKITGNDGNDFDLSLNDIIENIEVKGGQSLSGEDLLNLMKDEIFTLEAKRQKALLSSFSNVLWKDIVPKFGLLASGTWHQFDHLVVPNASLPPSFHRKVMWIAVQWLDVYQEMEELKLEYKSRRDNFAQVMVSLACMIDFSAICQVQS